jgi:tetratricopeptide (TPR) repeat protein
VDEALALGLEAFPRLLNNKARIFTETGDDERALALLRQADSLPEAKDDPRLQRVLKANMVECLCHLDHYAEAAALMPKVWAAAPESSDELTLVRLHWLDGRVAGGLGRTAEALEHLEAARQAFLRQDIAYDVALVTLEMAKLHLNAGRTAEVRKLVREMAPIFESQRVHREALAALRLFREAVQRERATAELARRMVAYLYRARNNPELRFESTRTGRA